MAGGMIGVALAVMDLVILVAAGVLVVLAVVEAAFGKGKRR